MPRTFEDAVNFGFDRAAAFTGHPGGLLHQIRDKVARTYLELGVFP